MFDYLVTSRARRQLLRRLWADGVSGSVSAPARASGVSFAAAHRELEAMKAAGLTVAERDGVATVCRANLAHRQADVLTALLTAAPRSHGASDEQRLRGGWRHWGLRSADRRKERDIRRRRRFLPMGWCWRATARRSSMALTIQSGGV